MRPDVHRPGEAENRLEAWQRGRFDHALRRLRVSGLIPKVRSTAQAVEGAGVEVYTVYGGVDEQGLRYPRVVLLGPWSHIAGREAELQTKLGLVFWADESSLGDGLNLRVWEEEQRLGHSTTVAVGPITSQRAEEVLKAFRANPSREGLLPLLQPNPSSPRHAR